ncbi:Protein CDI [Hibiscus syriacus]|uniref:Protein CDI n=1 Tax=Hibiscus syriacus TaxID=106335 RepID=A0A6A3CBI0_HIBSY|nr:Protein CDI [Hibiscus syriacus]
MTTVNVNAPQVTNNGGGSKPFKILIGYDPHEDEAYEKGLYWRQRNEFESTEFSFSRFLTPYLANYQGWAMFVDCDFLYLADIDELKELIDEKYAVITKRAPEVVNNQTGAFLHRFQWLEDGEIGSFPFVWNFLEGHNKVDKNDPKTTPKAIHYTRGGPWFEAWKNCEFVDLWLKHLGDYTKEKKSNAS